MESLVGSVSIISKGRFEDHLSHGEFYGDGETRESFKEKAQVDDRVAEKFAIPRIDYNVVIEAVLVGYAELYKITYRIYEAAPINRLLTAPNIGRVFFLNRNPDGTYSPMGRASVLNLVVRKYSYAALTPYFGYCENKLLGFATGLEAKEFEDR
jgi:hypothetical protein